mgnify:CR=1 FL=1
MILSYTRRSFLLQATACGGTAYLNATKATAYEEAGNKLRIAAVGVANRGSMGIAYCSGEDITALCDVDAANVGRAQEAFPKASRYSDYRVMLEKEQDIDAVLIAVPDHMHFPIAMAAIQLGKHVYVEKPMGWTVEEVRQLTQEAARQGVVTQMGIQGHAIEDGRRLCEMIGSGVIGAVREVHVWTSRPDWPQGMTTPLPEEPVPPTLDWDLWLGNAPHRPYNQGYCPRRWRVWWDFGTGALGDMGCHLLDPVHWALKLGAPLSVEVVKREQCTEQSGPLYSTLKYEFPARGDLPPVTVYWYDGIGKGNFVPRPEGLPEDTIIGDSNDSDNGSLFVGDKGFITAGEYGGRNPRLVPDTLMEDYEYPEPTLQRIGWMDRAHWKKWHHWDWIRACKGGPEPGANFNYAGPLTETVLLGNVALRACALGQTMQWDSENMRSQNVPEASLSSAPVHGMAKEAQDETRRLNTT